MSEKIIITSAHEQPTTTSLNVAKVFDKQHKNVLRGIENLMGSNLSSSQDWFFESVYIDKLNRKKKCYEMTKDGFVLLAMGFTGEKALALKIAYIEQFNAMERELQEKKKNDPFYHAPAVIFMRQLMPAISV